MRNNTTFLHCVTRKNKEPFLREGSFIPKRTTSTTHIIIAKAVSAGISIAALLHRNIFFVRIFISRLHREFFIFVVFVGFVLLSLLRGCFQSLFSLQGMRVLIYQKLVCTIFGRGKMKVNRTNNRLSEVLVNTKKKQALKILIRCALLVVTLLSYIISYY